MMLTDCPHSGEAAAMRGRSPAPRQGPVSPWGPLPDPQTPPGTVREGLGRKAAVSFLTKSPDSLFTGPWSNPWPPVQGLWLVGRWGVLGSGPRQLREAGSRLCRTSDPQAGGEPPEKPCSWCWSPSRGGGHWQRGTFWPQGAQEGHLEAMVTSPLQATDTP